jgi:hypothetical protein
MSSPPRLLDRVRATVRARHYSRKTEKAYVAWIRRFIIFHGKRHSREMGAAEVTRYLSSLAIAGHVAASTQNQALSAIMQPKTNHFGWTKDETVVQVHGVGPWGVTYVNPADDPRKK